MFIKPIMPPYDPIEWSKKPFAEKSRMVCLAWAMQGYGTPLGVYFVYVLKIAFYIYGWIFFCRFTPGMGDIGSFGTWWHRPEAFQKAIIWSMLFEILGLGCGSGPLTGRYLPPVGGALYFLRPGTTKLPLFEGVPVIGGFKRTLLDVLLYAMTIGCAVWVLVSEGEVAAAMPCIPIVLLAMLLPVLGILDKTLFLAARGEHYWTTIMIFVLAPSIIAPMSYIPGAKAIHAALWFWAGFSKLNHHFPSVVGVMTSNSPFTRFEFIRKMMYRSYPDDLGPSKMATIMGHAGTVLELAVPIILLTAHGNGTQTIIGLVLMIGLHAFITSNVPMGVPLEWNVIMVYGGFFLFWKHSDVSILEMSLPCAIVVCVMGIIIPLAGNLVPSKIPFLLAMRYYAGNWAFSVWLFEGESYKKLGKLKKSSGWIYDQLGRLYDRASCIAVVGKVMAFRLMHLHGRVLSRLVPKAVGDRFSEYEWIDGELVAGIVLGWNFGDGHLHREELLRAVQSQCGFEEGELRCIMVEAQPFGGKSLHYRVMDAKTGLIEEGEANVSDLRKQQPWGTVALESAADGE